MTAQNPPSPQALRAARKASPKARARDLAASLGTAEASLCAAICGHGATRIDAHPDAIIAHVTALGRVMALTRNESCVIEKSGIFDNYRSGPHAALVVNEDIDLRLFPKHWVHAFAMEEDGPNGPRRSVQVFDAAGDAIHKIYLREDSNIAAFQALVDDLRLPDQGDSLKLTPRQPPAPAKGNPQRADELRAGWDAMTDTHQFMRLTARLKMNRLGAYRMAGAPYVRPLAPGAVETLIERAAETGVPTMFFVGNQGCIEIHTGPIHRIVRTGPWINVLDPGFDLHLRMDHIAETYAVVKNTQRGPAHSVEFFDHEGGLIAQIFGVLRAGDAAVQGWNALVADLPTLSSEVPPCTS